MTSGILWNYYRNEINENTNESNAANNKINNNKIITSISFEYETKLTGSTSNNNNILDAEFVVSLKYLSNFWRSLDFSLLNFKTEIDFSGSKESVISDISIIPRIPPNPNANPDVEEVAAVQTTSAIFQINNAKLYVPDITLSINDNIKFLENIKQGFKKKNLEQI